MDQTKDPSGLVPQWPTNPLSRVGRQYPYAFVTLSQVLFTDLQYSLWAQRCHPANMIIAIDESDCHEIASLPFKAISASGQYHILWR